MSEDDRLFCAVVMAVCVGFCLWQTHQFRQVIDVARLAVERNGQTMGEIIAFRRQWEALQAFAVSEAVSRVRTRLKRLERAVLIPLGASVE